MSEKLWNELEKFWDKSEIERKAEEYQYLYEHPEKKEDFSWRNEKDNFNNKSKAIHWGVPNHVLGDIDKAKVIVGLLNPGTHMESEVSEKCDTVGKYIKEEIKIEQNSSRKVDYESKEVYQGSANNKKELHRFYCDHILSKENVISKDLKTLYKMYKEDRENLEYYLKNNDEYDFNLIVYYLGSYYSKVFSGKESMYKECIKHYLSIFDKMNQAELLGYEVEKEFEKALFDIKISNIELIPYRSFNSEILNNLNNMESSKLSAKILIKKILNDQEAIVILRSMEKWKTLFKNICDEEGIDFEKDIAPAIYKFKGRKGAISKGNIAPYKVEKGGNIKSVDEVVEEIREIIGLKDFESYLDEVIANNNN